MNISAAEFKTKCLKLMDRVNISHEEIIITKHGKPVAKLVPYSQEPAKPLYGHLKNSVLIKEDIIKPIDESWNAEE